MWRGPINYPRGGSLRSTCLTEPKWAVLQRTRSLFEKNITPKKRKRLYSEVFGSTVRTARSREKYDDFNEVTPIFDKAVSGDPNSIAL